jgi:fatty-acyl-CoA synthase
MSLEFINDDAQLYRPVFAYDWLKHHNDVNPNNIAIVDLDSGKEFTYQQFNKRSCQLANYLRDELGVKKSDRVAILAKNGNEYLEFYYACNKLGAISVLLNWRLTVSELEYIVEDSAPKTIVYDDIFEQQVVELISLCGVPNFLRISRNLSDNPYEEALAKCSTIFVSDPENRIRLIDVQTIMYTSGTTGKPKGAMITYNMTFYNAVNSGVPTALSTESANLVLLPLFHTGGLNCYANPAVHAGATNVIIRDFEPADCLQRILDTELGITHFLAVPAIYLFMSQTPDFAEASFKNVKHAAVGGAPIPLPTLMTWQEQGLPLKQGFGMTETGPSCLSLPKDKTVEKIGSVGLPVMHNEVRIVDDQGYDVLQGEIGELWVKGPNICPGYWNKPDANKSSFTDGWLHTGDASRQDEDGYYYIVDRWKDMYISGGENVYPAEVESVIYELEGVIEAAVIGIADEKWGEVGKIFLVLREGVKISEDDVLGHCAQKLAKFKVPRSVEVIDALPRNATGKVLKRELS